MCRLFHSACTGTSQNTVPTRKNTVLEQNLYCPLYRLDFPFTNTFRYFAVRPKLYRSSNRHKK